MKTDHQRTLLWRGLLTALLLTLVTFQVTKLANMRLLYDDAYLATAAKSVATGHGYATHYPATQPFDVRLGVGPALELPAAALIRVFGNRYWVPGLTTVLVTDLLLLAILLEMRRQIWPSAAWPSTAVAAVIASAVITADVDEWMLSHWYAFLGDLPAAFTVVLGAMLVGDAVSQRSFPGFAVGLVFGLALQIKLITALGIGPAVAATMWTAIANRKAVPRAIPRLGLFVFGVLAPTAAWHGWQLWVLGPARYATTFAAWASYFSSSNAGSGVSVLRSVSSIAIVTSRLGENVAVATEYLGGLPGVVSAFVIAVLAAARLWRAEPTGGSTLTGGLLFVGGAIHLVWWMVLSPMSWINHLLPAFIYVAVAIALSYSVPPLPRGLTVGVWVAIVLFVSLRASALRQYAPTLTRSESLVAELQARDYLLSSEARSSILLACGWWIPRDLEYLLPSVGNFRDCLQVPRTAFTGSSVLLVRSTSFWNGERNPVLDQFAQQCETQTLFRNDYYVISRCATSP